MLSRSSTGSGTVGAPRTFATGSAWNSSLLLFTTAPLCLSELLATIPLLLLIVPPALTLLAPFHHHRCRRRR